MSVANDIRTQIIALAEAGDSDSLKIALGDPTGARIVIAGQSYERGLQWGTDQLQQIILEGLANWLKVDKQVVTDIDLGTLNDERSQQLSGDGTKHAVIHRIVFQMTAEAGAANGDAQVTVGTSSGGTQILGATALTGLDAVNETFTINVTGNKVNVADDATIYIKVTTKDTTAGANTLANATVIADILD